MSVIEDVQKALDEAYEKYSSEFVVLEAGCGSGSRIRVPEHAKIVGIDISQHELDLNDFVQEKIVGDIQTYQLEEGRYQLIVCSDVLEHLPNPEQAVSRMIEGAASNGMILLTFPNVHSIKGLVAKITPMWFHNWIYRRIYKDKFGNKGLYPFPTYLRWNISPTKIEERMENENFEILFTRVHESGVQKRFRKMVKFPDGLARGIDSFLGFISFGRLTLTGSDYVILCRNKGTVS